MCSFWAFHWKGLIPLVVFCSWLLSLCILSVRSKLVAYCWVVFHWVRAIFFIHSTVDGYLGCWEWCCCEHFCPSLACEHAFSFLLSRFPGVEFLGHMINLYLTFSGIARLFSRVFPSRIILHSHRQWMIRTIHLCSYCELDSGDVY